jgi:hypothetical protein
MHCTEAAAEGTLFGLEGVNGSWWQDDPDDPRSRMDAHPSLFRSLVPTDPWQL